MVLVSPDIMAKMYTQIVAGNVNTQIGIFYYFWWICEGVKQYWIEISNVIQKN